MTRRRPSASPRLGGPRTVRGRLAACAVSLLLAFLVAAPAAAQEGGRRSLDRLRIPELRFDPPEAREMTLENGVTVFFMEDRSLPLVDVFARFAGGYARFPRDYYAAGTALPLLLRSAGTAAMSPDSVERTLERYAIQTSFGGSGESITARFNTLTTHLPRAMEIWGELLARPGFDTARVSIWRGQELESARRRRDNLARLAYSEFNRLMYRDNPVGWEMEEADLTPERLSRERLDYLHERIVCPDRLLLGVTGDVSWEEIRPLLEEFVGRLSPCPEPLPEAPGAEVGAPPGVYLIPREVSQSTVVLAHASGLQQGDTRPYFASRIGNAVLGTGGFSSRLLSRIRTQEGLAYGASSLWTTPRRYEGILGATTRTSTETTIPAIRLILETMAEMQVVPPSEEELGTTVDEAVNGFVFNFQSPAQIVTRRIAYRASGLPDDWLDRYIQGIQRVTAEEVRQVFLDELRVEDMVILVLGDPEGMPEGLESLGPVTIVEIAEVGAPGVGTGATPRPSGSPRSLR